MTNTAPVMQAMQALHNTQMDAIGKAAVDSTLHGIGVIVIDSNMSLRHVPVEKYLDLCHLLEAIAAEQKPTSG